MSLSIIYNLTGIEKVLSVCMIEIIKKCQPLKLLFSKERDIFIIVVLSKIIFYYMGVSLINYKQSVPLAM